jgi:MFS family permease
VKNNLLKLKPWLVWLPAVMFTCFFVVLQSSMGVMVEPVKHSFGINNFQIGLLSSSFYYIYYILQIPIGTLLDKFGVRNVLLISFTGTVFVCLGFSSSDTFTQAVIYRVLMGIFFASAFAASYYIGATWFSLSMFPLVAGLTEMIAMLGGFSLNSISIMVNNYGWRNIYILFALLSLVLLILAFIFVGDKKNDSNDGKQQIKILNNALYVLKNKELWVCGIFAGITVSPIIVVGSLWGVPFLMVKYGFKLENAADIIAMIYVGAALGSPIIAWFSAKFRVRKLTMLLGIVALFMLFIPLLFLQFHSKIFLMSIFFLIVFFASIYVISFFVVKDKVSSYACGTALAFNNLMCGIIGSIIFLPIIGYLLTCFESNGFSLIDGYVYSFLLIPLSFIPTFLLTCYLKVDEH